MTVAHHIRCDRCACTRDVETDYKGNVTLPPLWAYDEELDAHLCNNCHPHLCRLREAQRRDRLVFLRELIKGGELQIGERARLSTPPPA